MLRVKKSLSQAVTRFSEKLEKAYAEIYVKNQNEGKLK